MRAIIFINGEFQSSEDVRTVLQADDYIIAVNGGTHYALRVGVFPDVIVGDLDSLDPDEKARIKTSNVRILRFSSQKDETDLELAIRHALEQKATTILLFAALGGRVDQSLANVFLLTLPSLQGVDVQIIEGTQTIFLIRDTARIHGKPGDLVSILPVGGDAVGVTNEGLKWPLHEATLSLGTTRGVSNILLAEPAQIHVQKGMLLCVVNHHPQ